MSISSQIVRMGKSVASSVATSAERFVRLFPYITASINQAGAATKLSQLLLLDRYLDIRRGVAAPKSFRDVEFRAYSQNGEDGILLYIFGIIGFETRRSVEICAGDGIECNSANLIVNHGWDALLFDGDPLRIKRGQSFYGKGYVSGSSRDTFTWPPKLINAWITAENVNDLIRDNGFTGKIDLLSIDVDGMDYWIWSAIEVVQPRVVVVECNILWGSERSVTVPYNPQFRTQYGPYGSDYSGASLAAMVKLGRAKGYRFVGCEKYGFNAFFVREELAGELLPEANLADCLNHPFAKFAAQSRLPNAIGREWVEI